MDHSILLKHDSRATRKCWGQDVNSRLVDAIAPVRPSVKWFSQKRDEIWTLVLSLDFPNQRTAFHNPE